MSNEELGDVAATIARSRAPLQDTIKGLMTLRDTIDTRIREIEDLDRGLAELQKRTGSLLLGGLPVESTPIGPASTMGSSLGAVSPTGPVVGPTPRKPDASETVRAEAAHDSNTFDTNSSAGVVSVREAILMTLNSENRPFSTAEIHERVVQYGATAKNSMTTRSLISKLHNENLIRKITRGVYQAQPEVSNVTRETVQSRLYLLNDEAGLAGPHGGRPGCDTDAASTRSE